MQPNLPTAVTVIFGLTLASTVLAIAIRSARRTHPGYGRWAIAGLLLVLSFLLLSWRSAPGWINPVSADAGIAIASILYLEGAQQFRGLVRRNWVVYAGGVTAIGVVTFFRYGLPDMNARAAAMSAFLGIVLTLVSICLFRGIPPEHRFGQTFTSSMFGLCAATNVARAAYCYFGPPMNYQNVLSGLSGTFFLAVAGEMAAFSVGLTLIADERMTSDLQDVKRRVSRADVEVARHIEAESALRESEERYRDMAERLRESEAQLAYAQRLAKVGSFERIIENNAMQWSQETLRILGLPNAPTSFADFLTCIHPNDRQMFLGIEARVRSSTAPIEAEYRIVRPDGETRVVRTIVDGIKNDQGALVRIVGAAQDITGEVEAREVLRESQQHLASIYNTVRDVIFHLAVEHDEHFRFASVNTSFLRVTGLSREAVVGKMVSDVVPEPSLSMVLEKYRQAIEQHTTVLWEETSEYPAGRLVGEVSVTPVFDQTGKCTHLVGSVHDITDLKRTQEEALEMQKLECIGTLAGGIAHDFNNLLGAVEAQADLSLVKLAAGAPCKDELNSIREVAMRGSEIVRQLMIYAGKESSAVELIDLSNIVHEMFPLLQVSVSKHVVMDSELGRDLPKISASAPQMRQLLLNLVTNASDAIGDRDGVIRVITRHPISSLSERDCVALEVVDTGCGMSPETQARMFDPFYTTKSFGHGLGLAVVDGIVRSLGGLTGVTSELGEGTTVQILLPCAEPKCETPNHAMSTIEESVSPSTQATVLIVEDEDLLRQPVAKMLRNSGFQVLEAADGSSAIDLLRTATENIDLILLDITLPGASSVDVIAEAARTRPDIRVVVTSAYSPGMLTTPLSASQVRGFIRKPFQFKDLVNELHRAASA